EVAPSQPGPLSVGTRFALKVRPGSGGYLVVLAISPGGDATFLFPNRFRMDNHVTKGQEVAIPYPDGLEIRPPAGEETYVAYLLEKNPFEKFPFGRYGAALVAGKLADLERRLEARGKQIDAD